MSSYGRPRSILDLHFPSSLACSAVSLSFDSFHPIVPSFFCFVPSSPPFSQPPASYHRSADSFNFLISDDSPWKVLRRNDERPVANSKSTPPIFKYFFSRPPATSTSPLQKDRLCVSKSNLNRFRPIRSVASTSPDHLLKANTSPSIVTYSLLSRINPPHLMLTTLLPRRPCPRSLDFDSIKLNQC